MDSALSIKNVQVYPLDAPLLAPFTIASTELKMVNNIRVEIELENGVRGMGEGGILPPVTHENQQVALSTARQQSDWLTGSNVGAWRRIAGELGERLQQYTSVQAAFETALLDALTRSRQLPLFQFFGGVSRRLITDITIPICNVDNAERLARQYYLEGFTSIKTKVGLDLQQDIECLLAIRRSHPNCRLILDANEGYTVEQAMQVIRELQQAGIDIALFEQPVARDDWEGLGKLTRDSGVLIAADESCRTPQDALRIAQQGLAQVLNIKLVKCGVVKALEIAAIARAADLSLMIGEMVETRLGTSFSIHFAAGLGGFEWIDLDTPLLLAEDNTEGGYRREGATYVLDEMKTGNACMTKV